MIKAKEAKKIADKSYMSGLNYTECKNYIENKIFEATEMGSYFMCRLGGKYVIR